MVVLPLGFLSHLHLCDRAPHRNAKYELRKGGFVLKPMAGGDLFRTQGRHDPWIKVMVHSRLSKAALGTLAIVACDPPAICSDIEHV
ncbi:hypothetical protein DSCW_13390 [Desulfosarcina widdelii]|uniref:Uncharacterized protein n=1 Tax=Desulfosarcina widdelii TaxID=947919 RepID=A0A5K7YVZ8_9BACT|nr:SMC-Scp complex subunit ScpB [Desulfosarcina widdelii]BBO73922.1 hypothetical protein DSCW_13390 [Desulfosarcina widdelii]